MVCGNTRTNILIRSNTVCGNTRTNILIRSNTVCGNTRTNILIRSNTVCGNTQTNILIRSNTVCGNTRTNIPASTPTVARGRQIYRSNIGIRLRADVTFVRWLDIGPRAANLSGQHRHPPAGRCSFFPIGSASACGPM